MTKLLTQLLIGGLEITLSRLQTSLLMHSLTRSSTKCWWLVTFSTFGVDWGSVFKAETVKVNKNQKERETLKNNILSARKIFSVDENKTTSYRDMHFSDWRCFWMFKCYFSIWQNIKVCFCEKGWQKIDSTLSDENCVSASGMFFFKKVSRELKIFFSGKYLIRLIHHRRDDIVVTLIHVFILNWVWDLCVCVCVSKMSFSIKTFSYLS